MSTATNACQTIISLYLIDVKQISFQKLLNYVSPVRALAVHSTFTPLLLFFASAVRSTPSRDLDSLQEKDAGGTSSISLMMECLAEMLQSLKGRVRMMKSIHLQVVSILPTIDELSFPQI